MLYLYVGINGEKEKEKPNDVAHAVNLTKCTSMPL